MNWGSWLVWGFASTIVLNVVLATSQGMGMTRMNIPYLLGSMFTYDRDRAKLVGIAVHVLNGWAFSLLYVGIFHVWGATWWKGALMGFVHAAFVLVVMMPAFPALHPAMASERRGPTVVRRLEPPGFLGLHYGVQTPISVVIAHVIFGMILGGFYRP
jgi:uncharacterized membrane protein YagU involved in acid resistance